MTRIPLRKFLALAQVAALAFGAVVPANAQDSLLDRLRNATNTSRSSQAEQEPTSAEIEAELRAEPKYQAKPFQHKNQVYRFVDSLKRVHLLPLPAKLEPKSLGDLRLYVDSNMVLDTMSYAEFSNLEPAARGRVKYGRALHFGLQNAERHYGADLETLKPRILHDTLAQIRLIRAEKAYKQRVWTAVGIGGAGIAVGYLMILSGTETRCVEGPNGTMDCTEEGLSKRNSLLALGSLLTGASVGGILLFSEFDEEKLAKKVLAQIRR
jgi:hypothetical protein